MVSFYEYIQHVIDSNKVLKEKNLDKKKLNLKDLSGGVNKKFDPSMGRVITMKNNARSDYEKEDRVKKVLEENDYTPSFLKSLDKPYYYYFISFQNSLDDSDDVEELYGRERVDFRRVSIYENMNPSGYLYINQRQQLFSCIHQLMFIHFILFVNRIKHGDMHMKNIKWIKFHKNNKDFYSIKAFDFGHAEVNCGGIIGSRYTDINYLFKLKSQKKFLVGFFEGKSRLKDYISGENQNRIEKHFPLHHLLTNHQVPSLKKMHKNIAIDFLNREGDRLERNLRKIKDKDITNQYSCNLVLKEFAASSERVVGMLR